MGNASSLDRRNNVVSVPESEDNLRRRTQSSAAVLDNSERETAFLDNVNAPIENIIERIEVDPSVILDREFKKIYWSTNDVLQWLEMKGWDQYKRAFLEKKIDGTSLAELRPLTLVRELRVSPLNAFPLFNDISPLFLSSNFRVKNFDLDFRRKVDISMIEENPNKRINFRTALKLLSGFRLKDVEGSDPAMEYFIGKLGREVLIFLRRPPTAKEQAILGGWPIPEEKVCSNEKEQEGESPSRSICSPLTLKTPGPGPTTGGYSSEEGDECPICLTPFQDGRKLMALPCAHLFCQKCITDWLRHDRSCPICLMNPDDEELSLALLDDEESTPCSPSSALTTSTVPTIRDKEFEADPLFANFLTGPNLGPSLSDDEKRSLRTSNRRRKKKSKQRFYRPELGEIGDEKSILGAPNIRRRIKRPSSRTSYDLRALDDEKSFVISRRGKKRSGRRKSSGGRSVNFSVPSGVSLNDDDLRYILSSSKRVKRRGQRRASQHIQTSRHRGNRARAHIQRSQSYQFNPSGDGLCALCKMPINILDDRVPQPCGHIFHTYCSGATGDRGGCPFCPETSVKWLIRKQSRWLDFPPNIGRLLDDQTRRARSKSNVVMFQGKLFEVNAAELKAVDMTHNPPRSYRIKRQEIPRNRQSGRSNENSCSVM